MRKAVLFMIIVLLSFPLYSTPEKTRPITFDDFIRIKRISDPQVSPEGNLIAFVVTEYDKSANRGNSDIWIVPITGGNPWKLTTRASSDTDPRWSPDGSKIAFISTRDGSSQVWMIPRDGGEAFRVSGISTGASGLTWSPTGKHLAFASNVYPDCPDDDCNRERIRKADQSPVKAKMFGELLFRHWNYWRDGRYSHLFVMDSAGGRLTDMTPGDFDTPPLSLGSSHDYAFSPDGKHICFVRNSDPEIRKSLGTNNDLFMANLESGDTEPLTSNRANDNGPLFSADGRYLAYRAMSRPGYEADEYDLIVLDRKTGKSLNLTEPLDRSVDEYVWSLDSRQLYLTFSEHGRTVLCRASIDDQAIERILSGHTLGSIRLDSDGKRMIFLKQSINSPNEIFSFEFETEKLVQLTDFNGALMSELELNPAEEFWFEGAAGDRVHGFLVKPPFFSADKKYPLVMLLHGGPQGAWADNFHYRWNAQMFAAPGYVVAMVNFHGSTGYGQAFTDSIRGDWGGKPYQDIMKGLDHLLNNHDYIDAAKVGVAGASYGGYMADWIEGQTDRFVCLISHAGVFDLPSMHGATEELWFPEWEFHGPPWSNREMYDKWSPSTFVQNFKTPCLVIHGQLDFRVPVTQGFQFFTALQRMNVPSEMLYFPDEGHFVTKPQNAELWWETVHEWLARYLK